MRISEQPVNQKFVNAPLEDKIYQIISNPTVADFNKVSVRLGLNFIEIVTQC
jgi:hypothetical protein